MIEYLKFLENRLLNLSGWEYRRCVNKNIGKKIDYYSKLLKHINIIIEVINNSISQSDLLKGKFFKLIFVGNNESIKEDVESQKKKLLTNDQFKRLDDENYLNKLNLDLHTLESISLLNYFFGDFYPLFYNGTPDSGWLHVSYNKDGNRKQKLRAFRNDAGKTQYEEI